MKRLSMAANVALKMAASEAVKSKQPYIEKEHLLIGITSLEKIMMFGQQEWGLTPQGRQELKAEHEALDEILGEFQFDTAKLRRMARAILVTGDYKHTDRIIHRSEACKLIFSRAEKLVELAPEVSCLHLLAALLEEPGEEIGSILKKAELDPSVLRDHALVLAGERQELDKDTVKSHEDVNEKVKKGTHYLDRYGRDLTKEAREGNLGPFVGRRKELLQIIQTLARSTKNNPVLVGEAGVGKTAIVEALAMRVALGKDPNILKDKRIIELNMGSLVGGTKHRGEFEKRLTNIIREAQKNPEVILFIDEIHNLVGAGRAEGSMDAANIMKPALAQGGIRCIGATTIAEYRRYIESDSALERRFEKIIVDEPGRDETLAMLKGLCPKWEEHHHVHITEDALEAAMDLSVRFDIDHKLPDKAIDLLDKAGAQARVPVLSMNPELDEERERTGDSISRDGRGTEITAFSVAQVLSEKIGVPLEVIIGHLNGRDGSRILELASALKEQIIGQDEAIEKVCRRLQMAYAGLGKRRGPMAVFLFLGSTGVGKTQFSKSLAKFLFGSESDMIRFDMSEYMEEHSVAKFIGSPPGYVGHEEEGLLTGNLRTKPHSIVLFDDIEKAHPRIFDLFLQIFDEGRLSDSKGRTVDAKNAIFIMTSNISVQKHVGFRDQEREKSDSGVYGDVEQMFRPEFINRIDEQIVFRSLDKDDLRKILRPMLDEISDNLHNQHGVNLQISEDVEIFITQEGLSLRYGIRELRRTVEQLIQIPLSRLILSGELKEHKCWEVICDDGKIFIIPQTVENR